MDIPRFDFHIHTRYLRCANQTMVVADIVRECERLGVQALAITDHHRSVEQLELHRAIREDLLALPHTSVDLYFGIEIGFAGCDQGFNFSEELKEKHGFQFIIGGIHATYLDKHDLREMVDIQHRHHLQTCRDPLVQVLVHPYWFNRGEFENRGWPWFDAMPPVPASYARELGQAARETGTAIEVNGTANLDNPAYSERFVAEYLEYLAIVAAEGPCFSPGSDAHDINRLASVRKAWEALEKLQVPDNRIWRPAGEPLIAGAGRGRE